MLHSYHAQVVAFLLVVALIGTVSSAFQSQTFEVHRRRALNALKDPVSSSGRSPVVLPVLQRTSKTSLSQNSSNKPLTPQATLTHRGAGDYQVLIEIGSFHNKMLVTLDTGSWNFIAAARQSPQILPLEYWNYTGSTTSNCSVGKLPNTQGQTEFCKSQYCDPMDHSLNRCCLGGAFDTPGSFWEAEWCRDNVVFDGHEFGGSNSARPYIAAVWNQTNVFSSWSNALWGLGKSVHPPDLFTQMVNDGQGDLHNVFSLRMCPAAMPQSGALGFLFLGVGKDLTCNGVVGCGLYQGGAAAFLETPFANNMGNPKPYPENYLGWYEINILDMAINGITVDGAAQDFAGTNWQYPNGTAKPPGAPSLGQGANTNIFDSGWTGLGIMPSVFSKVSRQLKAMGFGPEALYNGSGTCYDDVSELSHPPEDWPTLSFTLPSAAPGGGTITLDVPPKNWISWGQNNPGSGPFQLCSIMSNSGPNNGNALGNGVLNNYYAVFDRDRSVVSLAPATTHGCDPQVYAPSSSDRPLTTPQHKPTPTPSHHKLTTADIIGIAVGSSAGFTLVAVGAGWFLRRVRSHSGPRGTELSAQVAGDGDQGNAYSRMI